MRFSWSGALGATVLLSAALALVARAQLDTRPHLIADINQRDNQNSNPVFFVQLGAVTLFRASADAGEELHRSDGTRAGTTRVVDLRPGGFNGMYGAPVVFGGAAYFTGDDGAGARVFKTDGTSAGTSALYAIGSVPSSRASAPMAVVNGKLVFFTSGDATAPQIISVVVSDGTEAGTARVADVATTDHPVPPEFAIAGTAGSSTLVFVGWDAAHGAEPWVTDGTQAGTHMLADVRPGVDGSSPLVLGAGNGKAYLRLDNGTTGNEIYATDGTTLTFLGEHSPSGGTNAAFVAATATTTYLRLNTPAEGYELWKTDGTPAGTQLVVDLCPGAGTGFQSEQEVVMLGGFLYFSGNDCTGAGLELWRTDGTAQNTTLVKDIVAGATGSRPLVYPLGTGSSKMLVAAHHDTSSAIDLYVSDGTGAGTTLLRSFTTGVGSRLEVHAMAGSTTLFAANDGVSGTELWSSDGTVAGTKMVANINAQTGPSNARDFVRVGDKVVFHAKASDASVYLHSLDGDALAQGAALGVYATTLGRLDDALWLGCGVADTDPVTLCHADASGGGVTVAATNGAEVVRPVGPILARPDRLLFVGNDAAHGNELWALPATGTPATDVPVRLTDLVPGAANATIYSYATSLDVGVVDTAYVVVKDGAGTVSLLRSDGTAAGTEIVSPLAHAHALFGVGEAVYFVGVGTPAPSASLLRIRNGGAPELVRDGFDLVDPPLPLGTTGSLLVFAAAEVGDASGTKLWVSDGTAAGTAPIATLDAADVPQPNSVSVGGAVLFVTGTFGDGWSLWRTDGTASGTTRLLGDLRGNAPTLVRARDRAFLLGETGVPGSDLYEIVGTTVTRLQRPAGASSGGNTLDAVLRGTLYLINSSPAYGAEPYAYHFDDTVPTYVARVEGEGGRGPGWYRSDVRVAWDVAGGIDDDRDCRSTLVTSDGDVEVACHGVTTTVHRDNVAPVVTCPAPITLTAEADAETVTLEYTASATDDRDPAPAITAGVDPGASVGVGTTTVTVTATDLAGNTAACSFDVTVTADDAVGDGGGCCQSSSGSAQGSLVLGLVAGAALGRRRRRRVR